MLNGGRVRATGVNEWEREIMLEVKKQVDYYVCNMRCDAVQSLNDLQKCW